MKAGHGIFKGKGYERECANLLTKITGKKWHRTSNSGAMATAQGITDSRFKGDLFCEDISFEDVCVECKITGKKITISNMVDIIERWWNQTVKEAGDKVPVLIFTFSGSKSSWLIYKADVNNPLKFVSNHALRGMFGKYELKMQAFERKFKGAKGEISTASADDIITSPAQTKNE